MLKVTDKYYIDADDKYFNVVEKAVNHKTGKITSWNRASFKKNTGCSCRNQGDCIAGQNHE